jgi:hypothetical protein
MLTNYTKGAKEIKIAGVVTIIATSLLSLFFLMQFLNAKNAGDEYAHYNLPFSIAFFAQMCIAVLGLIKRKKFLVFITISSYLFLVILYITLVKN